MLERNQTQQHQITMKRPSLKDQFGESESSVDDQIREAIVEALSANDKVIEIRPAKRSKGMRLKRLLLLGAAAIAFAYWVQNSQKPNNLIKGVKEKTANRIHQTAESIEKGSESASERIEESSERASEAVHEAAEKASDKAEEAGEKVSDKAEEAGEKASEKAEEAGEKASDKAEESGEEVVERMVKGDKKTSDETDSDDSDDSDSSEK
ncbi:hypothetical protein [Halorubrum lacusprofundi]|uniref:hypothetical protein n=1 Tax=Halorubrum lacusprofundi TaxID=2247 RepID=UPI000B5A3219|nr:hypothetical protein [Halorubrum lacusprofundi]MCG1007128.1 hypothetical protein [Halorubrum lacusprofundi]